MRVLDKGASTMSSGSDKAVKVAGYLEKKSKLRMMSRWKKLWFVLDGRLLLYYKSRAEYLSLSPCRGTVNMGLATDVASGPKAKSILVHTRSHAIALRALSRREHEAWLRALVDAMSYQPVGSRPPPISYQEAETGRGMVSLDVSKSEAALLDVYGTDNRLANGVARFGSAGEVNNNRRAAFSPLERRRRCDDDCEVENRRNAFDRNNAAYFSAGNVNRHVNRLNAPAFGSTGNISKPAPAYGSSGNIERSPKFNGTGNIERSPAPTYASSGNERTAPAYGSSGNVNRQPPAYSSSGNVNRLAAVYSSSNNLNRQQAPAYGSSGNVNRQQTPAYGSSGNVNRQQASAYGSSGNVNRQQAPAYGSSGNISRQPSVTKNNSPNNRQAIYGSTGDVNKQSPIYGTSVKDDRQPIYGTSAKERTPAPAYGSNGNISRNPAPIYGSTGHGKLRGPMFGSAGNVNREPGGIYGSSGNVNKQVYGSSDNVSRQRSGNVNKQVYGSSDNVSRQPIYGSTGNVRRMPPVYGSSQTYGSNGELKDIRASKYNSNGNLNNSDFDVNSHANLYSPAYGSTQEITSSRAALCTSVADSNKESKLTKRPLCLGEYREKINKKWGKIAMSDSSIPGRFRTRGEEGRGLRRSASVEGDLGDNIYESVRDSLYSRGASLRRSDSDCLFLARHRLARSHPFRSEQRIADYGRARWAVLAGGKQARSDTDLTMSPRMIHATNSGTLWFSRKEGASMSSSLAATAGTAATRRRPARSRSFLARLVAPAAVPARRSLSFLKRLWAGPDRDKLRRDLIDSSRLSPFQYEDFERVKVRDLRRYQPPMPEPPPDYDEVNISSGESDWESKSMDSWDGWEEVILAQWERAAAPTPWTDDDRPTLKGKSKMRTGRRGGKGKRGAADTMDAKGKAWDGWDTWASRPRDTGRTKKDTDHIKRDSSPKGAPRDPSPVLVSKDSPTSPDTTSTPSSPTSSPVRSSPPPKKTNRLKVAKRAAGNRQRVPEQSDFGDSESSEMALRRLFSEEETSDSRTKPDVLDDMLRRLHDINSTPLQSNSGGDSGGSGGEPDYDVPRPHGLAARINRTRPDTAPLPPTHFLQPAFHDSLDPTSPYDEVAMAPDSLECDPWSDDGCDSWATYAPIHKRFPPDSLNPPLHT